MRAGDAKQFRAANIWNGPCDLVVGWLRRKQDPFLNLENCLPNAPRGKTDVLPAAKYTGREKRT